jgi:hypothetical protein
MPALVELGPVVLAGMALLLLFGIVLVVKLLAAILNGIPVIGGWLAKHLTQPVLNWLNAIQHDLLDVLESAVRLLVRWYLAVESWTNGVWDFLFHLNEKTNVSHNAITGLSKTVNGSSGLRSLRSEVDGAAQKAAAAKVIAHNAQIEIGQLRRYLNGAKTAAIDQRILRAEHDAEVHSAAAFAALRAGDEAVLHRRIRQLEVSLGITIPDAAQTIPIALAGVMAYVAVLEAEAARCWNPMCSDWRLAKNLLEGLLAGFGAAGALEFLANAVQHPETMGKLVAGYADEVGKLSVDTLYGILGLPVPPLPQPGP